MQVNIFFQYLLYCHQKNKIYIITWFCIFEIGKPIFLQNKIFHFHLLFVIDPHFTIFIKYKSHSMWYFTQHLTFSFQKMHWKMLSAKWQPSGFWWSTSEFLSHNLLFKLNTITFKLTFPVVQPFFYDVFLIYSHYQVFVPTHYISTEFLIL